MRMAAAVEPAADFDRTEYIERAFQAHRLAVLRFCLSRLRDQDDAEDAVQEVFARAVRHRDELHGDALAWLIRAASNVCIDELRRRSRHSAEALDDDANEVPAAAEEEPEAVVVGQMLITELLSRLTPSERQVVADRALLDTGRDD